MLDLTMGGNKKTGKSATSADSKEPKDKSSEQSVWTRSKAQVSDNVSPLSSEVMATDAHSAPSRSTEPGVAGAEQAAAAAAGTGLAAGGTTAPTGQSELAAPAGGELVAEDPSDDSS